MNTTLRRDADEIICSSIQAVLPDKAVCRALEDFQPGGGRVLLVAAGKAAWQMAHAAVQALGRVDGGVVVTKYGHVKGEIPGVACYEAGHPVPDANGFAATQKALELVQGLTAEPRASCSPFWCASWARGRRLGSTKSLPGNAVFALPPWRD